MTTVLITGTGPEDMLYAQRAALDLPAVVLVARRGQRCADVVEGHSSSGRSRRFLTCRA